MMSMNKTLGLTVAGLLTAAILSVLVVKYADYPPRIGLVDHLFDFHLDTDRLYDEAMEDKRDRDERQRNQDEWARDINDFNNRDSDRGTYCTPGDGR
jgi:hypothetical protein